MAQPDGDGDGGGDSQHSLGFGHLDFTDLGSPEWPKAQRENVSHDVLHIAWVAEQR